MLDGEIENTQKNRIRVGRDYQVKCPEYKDQLDDIKDKDLLVWKPSEDIPDDKIRDYVEMSKQKYGYNDEQALGMLFWHKYDLEKASRDLANFTPLTEKWTEEDKIAFQEAARVVGGDLNRLQKKMPDKTMGSILKYYYSWKRTPAALTLLGKKLRKKSTAAKNNGSSSGTSSDNGSLEETGDDDGKSESESINN